MTSPSRPPASFTRMLLSTNFARSSALSLPRGPDMAAAAAAAATGAAAALLPARAGALPVMCSCRRTASREPGSSRQWAVHLNANRRPAGSGGTDGGGGELVATGAHGAAVMKLIWLSEATCKGRRAGRACRSGDGARREGWRRAAHLRSGLMLLVALPECCTAAIECFGELPAASCIAPWAPRLLCLFGRLARPFTALQYMRTLNQTPCANHRTTPAARRSATRAYELPSLVWSAPVRPW